MRNAVKILVGRSEGKGQLGKPTNRWEGNTRMFLREMGWEGVDWIRLAQKRDQ
jgi:hypothetical protein